jgi:putative transposase
MQNRNAFPAKGFSAMRQDGIQLKSTRHAKYQSGHHFVWIPFKRRKIFRDEAIIKATKRYIREAAANNDR